MDKILSWIDPTSWIVRIVAAVLLIAVLSFGWFKFKLWVSEPYVEAARVEMQHTIDAHISEKVGIQSKLDSFIKAGALEVERQTIQAKAKEINYKKEIENAKTEAQLFKSLVADNNSTLDSLRDTADRVRSSCTAGDSELSVRIAESYQQAESDLGQALGTTAEAIEIAREAIAAAEALKIK